MSAVQRHLQAGDGYQALLELRAIVASAPPLGVGWGNVARLARALQDIDLAVTAAELWRRSAPNDRGAHELLFELLSEIGESEQALKIARVLATRRSNDTKGQYLLGLALARLGQFEPAEAAFSAVIAAQPLDAFAWEQLSIIKRFTSGDPDIDNLRAIKTRLRPQTEAHAALLYALGKAYDDVGDVDNAFAAFEQGARTIFALHPFNLPPLAAHHARLRSSFSRPLLDHFAGCGEASERPIFILGLPRSGTTLVEQILSAHPKVAAGGEMRLLPLAATPLRNLEPVDIQRFVDASADKDPWGALGREYLACLSNRFGPHATVTDKGLATHMFVGAIRLMLPGARFIYCRRDPRDIAWSAFRSRFSEGQWWSYDLRSIARYQQIYGTLMDHWRSIAPASRLLTIDYETLVSRPDMEIPRLLDFAGLSHEPACFTPHLSSKAVLTRSLAQVRNPINTRSVGNWRRYETHLAPYLSEMETLSRHSD